jgi:hypothetical protein
LSHKELAKLGYIRFDIESGIAENGKIICLVTEEEKFILKTIRDAFGGSLPDNYNLELRINELNPLIFNFKKQ